MVGAGFSYRPILGEATGRVNQVTGVTYDGDLAVNIRPLFAKFSL